jgi:hypothetical protein
VQPVVYVYVKLINEALAQQKAVAVRIMYTLEQQVVLVGMCGALALA